jgi:predicted nucleic acid-binding Zn ribbon protein
MVGEHVAAHVAIETFQVDPGGDSGVLVLRADSTAWATQVKYMLDEVSRAVDDDLGPGRVRDIVIHGPAAPSWKHGPRTVQGRGPRDTYG